MPTNEQGFFSALFLGELIVQSWEDVKRCVIYGHTIGGVKSYNNRAVKWKYGEEEEDGDAEIATAAAWQRLPSHLFDQ